LIRWWRIHSLRGHKKKVSIHCIVSYLKAEERGEEGKQESIQRAPIIGDLGRKAPAILQMKGNLPQLLLERAGKG
jgi:hypothetical protein